MILPSSTDLDVGSFSRIFEMVTNSYKFLFFQALLDEIRGIRQTQEIIEKKVSISTLVSNMVERAKPLVDDYHLSFGVQDKMAEILRGKETIDALGRYVPFRLLSSFFENELKGKKDHEKNGIILGCSISSFSNDKPPLYRLDRDGKKLVLNPRWIGYIQENFPIVDSWFKYQWLSYLQDKNLAVPNLKYKIDPDFQRRGIPKAYQKFWRTIVQQENVHCIYSGVILNPADYALDHYIPYSYLAHNELWNLVPVSSKANSSKSDSLAAPSYLKNFLEIQYSGIRSHKKFFEQEGFSKIAESYMSGLRISKVQILEKEIFQKHLHDVIVSLRDCAKLTGFSDGWSY
ncbi:MAG: HNH endonuclease domain-containing protein [Leptospirillum sp.]